MMYGEAVCFLRPGLAEGFKYLRKQGMQLASKMRFIAAQYIAYLTDDLWKECAAHSNTMALELEKRHQDDKGGDHNPEGRIERYFPYHAAGCC